LQAYLDETREALAGLSRPGNAGANTAADHVRLVDLALSEILARYLERIEIRVRANPLAPRAVWWTTAARRMCASGSAMR
jgi:thiazole synthase ThiGH ThiG subunit